MIWIVDDEATLRDIELSPLLHRIDKQNKQIGVQLAQLQGNLQQVGIPKSFSRKET